MGTGARTPWATAEAEREAAIRTLRGRVLEIGADVARYAVPVLGLEIPYVLIDARTTHRPGLTS